MGNMHGISRDKVSHVVVDESMIDDRVLVCFQWISHQNPNTDSFNVYSVYRFIEDCIQDYLEDKPDALSLKKLIKMICHSFVKKMLDSYLETEDIASFFSIILKASYAIMKKYDLEYWALKSILQFEDEDLRLDFYVISSILCVPLQSLLSLTNDAEDYLFSTCGITRNDIVKDIEILLEDDECFKMFMESCTLGDITAFKKFLIREEEYLSTDLADKLYWYLKEEINTKRMVSEKILLEIIQNFPEMTLVAMDYALMSNVMNEDCEPCFLVRVLKVISDYKNFYAFPYDLIKREALVNQEKHTFLWEDILDTSLIRFDGRTLNIISELLVHDFGISQEEVNSFIVTKTLQELEDIDSVMGLQCDYEGILSKLSNKIVYEIVETQIPALIDISKGRQGKYVWHKEETEGRIFYS